MVGFKTWEREWKLRYAAVSTEKGGCGARCCFANPFTSRCPSCQARREIFNAIVLGFALRKVIEFMICAFEYFYYCILEVLFGRVWR